MFELYCNLTVGEKDLIPPVQFTTYESAIDGLLDNSNFLRSMGVVDAEFILLKDKSKLQRFLLTREGLIEVLFE